MNVSFNKKYDYDIIIIGGGSAAFSSAIKANEFGFTNAIVNDGLPIGGTCVNVGCIPSKYLIRLAEYIDKINHSRYPFLFEEKPKDTKPKFGQIIKQKKEFISYMRKIKYEDIIKNLNKTTLIKGYAKFLDKNTILVNDHQITAKNIIIATGSSPSIPSIKGLENVLYYTNNTLFELEQLPEHLIILGGGYIGLEIAQAYRRFGSEVTLIESLNRVLFNQSEDISNTITQYLEEEGIRIYTSTTISEVLQDGKNIILKGSNLEVSGTHLLIATGRKPNTNQLNLEQINLKTLSSGHIIVNDYLQTNLSNIYAVGDCNQLPAFVYTAAYEGNIAVHNINACCENELQKIQYDSLPWVIFTDPQIAGCGYTEKTLIEKNIDYEKTILPINEIPRYAVSFEKRGFIKLLRNPKNDTFLGAEIIAPDAGELIMPISMAIQYNISVSEFSSNLFPYLTAAEGLKLASLTFKKDISKLSCCAF
jgi:mercuric reductase